MAAEQDRRADRRRLLRESWMHIEIDRRREHEDAATRSSAALQRVLQDVREAVEDWPKMHAQALAHRRRARRATRRRCPRTSRGGPGAARAGSPTTTSPSSATASTASRRDDGDDERCCARCPAPASASCAPTRTCPPSFGKLPAAGAGQGAREDPARGHQGELPGDRAPPGLPRLRRRQDVRRERRGRRRAPLPRAVLQRRLHRVADPDPGAAGEGRGRSIDRAGFDAAAATPARR